MKKIDINKKYIYESQPVELLCVDAGGNYPVVALVGPERLTFTFMSDGREGVGDTEPSLIEVKPSRWVNVYSDNSTVCHATRERADLHEHSNRIACVEVKEGEGL